MVFQVLIKTYLELPLEIRYIDEQLCIRGKYPEVKVFLPTLFLQKKYLAYLKIHSVHNQSV